MYREVKAVTGFICGFCNSTYLQPVVRTFDIKRDYCRLEQRTALEARRC